MEPAGVRSLVLRQPSLLARASEGLQSKVDAYGELFGQQHLGQVRRVHSSGCCTSSSRRRWARSRRIASTPAAAAHQATLRPADCVCVPRCACLPCRRWLRRRSC